MTTKTIVCDLCGAREVGWTYPAYDCVLTAPGVPHGLAGSVGAWAACDTCHDLVERNDRDGLVQRCAEGFVKRFPDFPAPMAELLDMARDSHELFFNNRSGPATRYYGEN